MKRGWEKYKAQVIAALIVVICGVTFTFLLTRGYKIGDVIRQFSQILAPFLYGFVIAYVLTPVFNWIRSLVQRLGGKAGIPEKPLKGISKGIASLISMLLLIFVVGGLLYMVLPQVIMSVMSIVEDIPGALTSLQKWLEQRFVEYPELREQINILATQVLEWLRNWAETELLPELNSILVMLSDSIMEIISFLKNVVLGMIVAVYMLNGKDHFAAQGRMLVYAVFPRKIAEIVLHAFSKAHQVFGGFLRGKLLDSFIIGMICFVFMSVIRAPYAMLISIIVGVTNIIPFFGPFIGAVPCILILLIESPKMALIFTIFIFILQQIDGNLIGPKVLGNSTGLSAFWVMFAILFFSGIWGFLGMIVGVPLFAVIYYFVSEFIHVSLKRKGLPAGEYGYHESHLPWKQMENLDSEEDSFTQAFFLNSVQDSQDSVQEQSGKDSKRSFLDRSQEHLKESVKEQAQGGLQEDNQDNSQK